MRRIWLAIGALALATAAVVVFANDFTAGAGAEQRQTFLQFNICGNACNNGELPVVVELAGTIRGRSPAAVTLNEVCENQYTRLRADLDAYQGRFDPTGPTCVNGERYGNAILLRSDAVELVGSWLLPSPVFDEPRRLMCLRTVPAKANSAGAVALIACVTHISNESGNIAAQVSAVAGRLEALGAGTAVLFGGDLNTDPGDARLEPLTGPGALREVDQTDRRDTYPGHKYDYIFLSDGRWSPATAEVVATSKLSDHYALWATATFAV